MKKILLIICLLFGVILVFNSCNKNNSVKTDSGSILIGLVMPETHVDRWVKDGASLKRFAESRGYRAEETFAGTDQNVQNGQIRTFIKEGAKLLIIGSLSEGIIPAVADAAKAKIPVIAYDRIIPNSADYDYYITFNNYEVGTFQGKSIEDGLDLKNATTANPKTIAFFAGAATDGNAFFFYDGAVDVLNPYIDKGVLKVIGPYPRTSKDSAAFKSIATENWQAAVAEARMKDLLANEARDVRLDAVLAPNDTLARAIIKACLDDPKYSGGNLPLITGQDAEADSILAIKNGQQSMTVFKDTTKLAEAAIILADQILKGEANPVVPGATLAAGDLAVIGDTGKKIVKAFLLQPIFINKDNWNIPVQAGYFTPEEEIRLK
ncbi:MAG: sugar-binding protein [Treponema sp.]|nr:sugar-binding protein [Treponema sp.]